MELTERKKKVLRSVVDLYIRTAEPVGSKAITELPDMNFSSATIRNEMADLTAMGYLEQPHTSAGRIPSPAGYRLYVDELMQDYRLSVDETKSINNAIEEKVQRVDKLVEKVAKLVSQATDLPAISAASRCDSATVSRFDLIQAGQGSFILVVMLSDDQVFNKLIKLPVSVDETDPEASGGSAEYRHDGASPGGLYPGTAGQGHAVRRKGLQPGAGDRGLHHGCASPPGQHQCGRCRSGKTSGLPGVPGCG